MKKLITIIKLVLGRSLTNEEIKTIAIHSGDYEAAIIPTKTASVSEYINELVEVNGWDDSDRMYLMTKVNQYQINDLNNDKLYIEVLKFISTR